jgi:hypothetical protein
MFLTNIIVTSNKSTNLIDFFRMAKYLFKKFFK